MKNTDSKSVKMQECDKSIALLNTVSKYKALSPVEMKHIKGGDGDGPDTTQPWPKK